MRQQIQSEIRMIYFIGDGTGLIKIGSSNNVKARLSELSTGNPRKLKLYALISTSIYTEKDLHYRFRKSRVRGEWFKVTQTLMSIINEHRHDLEHNLVVQETGFYNPWDVVFVDRPHDTPA